jgi:membrane-bound lytic murein transglycosylase D
MLCLPTMKTIAVLLLALVTIPLASAADSPLPRPAELEPDVQFWIRVYSEISTNEGFIHDQHRLSVVYETLHFSPDTPPRERERQVDAAREHYQGVLRRLAGGGAPSDPGAQRVRDLWGPDTSPALFALAVDDVRFQLGQSDRFRAGLARAGAWETHIAEVLANLGLPPEIAALPHVESSFDPTAYSKVGAAGLWQFIRSTGRRFLRIVGAVDERLDPFRETEAAAQLLSYNYRLLGTWPLAITAYNHGAEGMRRAREQLGTDDIVRIVRDYHSPSFGFASRNFYVSFLAALSIAREPERYFGGLQRNAETIFREVKMPLSASAPVLARTLALDRDTLKSLNPALRPPVWNGQRPIPAGYVLRLPATAAHWTPELLVARLRTGPSAGVVVADARGAPPSAGAGLGARAVPIVAALPEQTVIAEAPSRVHDAPAPAVAAELPASQFYIVQDGDSVASIAANTGITAGTLMALNAMRGPDYLYEGQPLRLFGAASASDPPGGSALEPREDRDILTAARTSTEPEAPSGAAAPGEGPQLGALAISADPADPVDYSVGADGTIRVVAAETLGHYADWLGMPAARLRSMNHLQGRTPLVLGRRIRLQFDTVPRPVFEQRRREYHARLQAAYFAAHRIEGTQVYIVRRGDSLWSITQRDVTLPVWLLQQYNPDLDFSDLHPGTQISLPQVEEISGP